MLNKFKDTLHWIDQYTNPLGSIAVFLSIMLAFAYLLKPDLRRYVEVTFTNREAWYRVGTIKPQSQRWGFYPTEGRGIIRNYYHVDWVRKNASITQKLINNAKNSVVVHTADFSVMGRALEETDGDNFKSNNPVVSLSMKDDCLYVKDIIFVNGEGKPVLEDTEEITAYVWMRAIKISCQ